VPGAHAPHGVGHGRRLRVGERVGDRPDRGVVEHLAVGAHHARQPLAGELARGGPAVGRGHAVVLGGQVAAPHVHVAGEREPLGRHPRQLPAERDAAGDRLRRGAHGARVHELPARQSLGVGAPAGRERAADDGHDVGGGRAGVEQQRVGVLAGDEPGGGRPVRRRHGQRLGTRRPEAEEAAVHRVHARGGRRQRRLDRVEHERHAVALRAEHLRELGGHRDRVPVAGAGADDLGHRAQHGGERPGRALHLVGCAWAASTRPPAARATFVFTPPTSHPTTPRAGLLSGIPLVSSLQRPVPTPACE
jgi:hypothetical protein